MPHNAEKTKTWHPIVSSSFVCYAKKGTTPIVQFPGPKTNFVKLLVELFWSLQVYQKNTDEKQ